MMLVGNKLNRAIYSFEFSSRYVYVGLSYNVEMRKYQHLNEEKSPVFTFLKETSEDFQHKILTDYISEEEAVKKERYYIQKYIHEGWTLLNTAKAGALGGSSLKWTFDRCFEIALEFENRKEFEIKYPSVYNSARRNKWLEDICSHMNRLQNPKNFWNVERCKQEALKYESRTQFHRSSGSAYLAARDFGILDNICVHMSKKKSFRIWTKEKSFEEALKYQSKKEFKANNSGAFSAASKSGFLDEICSHMNPFRKPNGYWDFENCKAEAAKYITRSEFQKKSISSYREALNNDWLDEICSHMTVINKPKNHWSKDNCHQEALKYKTRSEFQKTSNASYCKASKEKWLDEICSHMIQLKKPNNYWTKEKCHQEALKFNTKVDFREKASNIYSQAHRKGWLDIICCHMTPLKRPSDYWTKERIIEEAKKFSNRTDFNKNSGGAALIARGYGWYEEIWKLTHPND